MKGQSVKRLLVLVAVLAVLLNISPALAAESQERETVIVSAVKNNPLYNGEDVSVLSDTEEESQIHVAMDFQGAVSELRTIFKERKTAATLVFPVALESSSDDTAALEEELMVYEAALLQGALAHTGDPQEGDYLLCSIYQYGVEMYLMEEEGILFLGIDYSVVYHTTRAQELQMNTFLTNLINGWNLTHATDYQKVRIAYDWLCKNVTYAENIIEEPGVIYSAYGAIMNGESVCQGYATALYRILLALDVDCRIISGVGNDESHAWNIVKLGDYYYNADATWDAICLAKGEPYAWFLAGDEYFPDHTRSPGYMTEAFYAAYPMNTENYHLEVVGSGTCGDGLTWTLLDDGAFTISGTGDMYDYARYEAPWYDVRSYLKHIYIENGATSIGDYAFWWCDNLIDVSIAAGISSVGDYAFASCSRLTEVSMPEGVTKIGDSAFEWCSKMTAVEIPDSVTSIGTYAFYGCHALTKVILPEGLTVIADGLLNSCVNLPQITIPDSVTSIGKYAFADCDEVTSIVIPAGITSIADATFTRCDNLTEIVLPDSVTSIGKEAFDSCISLTSITLPEGVTGIGEAAFRYCYALTEITIPAGVTYIDNETFYECKSLTTITIPENVAGMGYNVFKYCRSLEHITIPGNVLSIGSNAFNGCSNLTSVTILEGLTAIGNDMFRECGKLTKVTIPLSVTKIGDRAFQYCSGLTSVTIPAGVTSIGTDAFKNCTGLEEVILSEGLATIGGSAFSSCTSLVNITIPKTVSDISGSVFAYCEKLEKIWFLGDAPTLGYNLFYSIKASVFYPAYATGWDAVAGQSYGGNIEWVAYEEGEETFTLTGTSVSLGESLDIHFFLSAYEVESTDYAVITRSYADGRADHVVTVPYSQWDTLDDGRLYITYSGVAAKEMNDTMSVVICDQEGNTISEVYTDSIQDYAMRLLRRLQIDGALQILLVDMLNYGAEAQLYFGYDTANLANAELTTAEQSYASEDYAAEDNLSCSDGRAATALTLKSRISLDMYFKNSVIGTDYANLYAIVTYTDHYDNPVEYRVEGEDFITEPGNRSYVSVTGLAIADYRQMVTCTVYDSQGNVLAWSTDSIEGYIARMDDEIPDIVAAIAKLGSIARYYFHTYLEFTAGVENAAKVPI